MHRDDQVAPIPDLPALTPGTGKFDPKASSMSGQPSSDHAADRTQVGEMNEVAILVADAELALSLDQGACHRPSMWRALGAEERRLMRVSGRAFRHASRSGADRPRVSLRPDTAPPSYAR